MDLGFVTKYKPFLLFLAKFFLSYLILGAIYQFYLSRYDEAKYEIDPITISVAKQSEAVMNAFGADVKIRLHKTQPSVKIFYHYQYVARIIEGCNAVSVMILFAAFVVAFSGKLKHTIWFIIFGCAVIHILNVARIALLCSAIYHFPDYENLLHGVLFPLFIYSVVFLLWVIWVNKFSSYAKKPLKA
ncbi:MAG: exosortase family protein XrtF [Flavobacterium sp.]|nr:MAG: exosortase family protein XrtF [Flavobacterium sp.]